jgi:hypothetical protein
MGNLCDSRKQVNNFNITDQIKFIQEEEEHLKTIRRNKSNIADLERDMRINQMKSLFFSLDLYLCKETRNMNDLGREDYSKQMAPSLKKVWDLYEDVKKSDFDIKHVEIFKKEITILTNHKKI